MSSARQSLGRLNDTLSFIPTVMTTSLATAPGTEATGAPAARMAQIEQVLEDALGELERTDIAVQMWAQMDAGPIEEKFNHLAALIQAMVIQHITEIATRSEEFRDRHTPEQLHAFDELLPEITEARIGNDTIPAIAELAGGAQANFKEVIGDYAGAIETELEEGIKAAVKATAAKLAAIPAEEESEDTDAQEQSRAYTEMTTSLHDMNWDIYKMKEAIRSQQAELDAKSATRRDAGATWKTRMDRFRKAGADAGATAKSEKEMQDDIDRDTKRLASLEDERNKMALAYLGQPHSSRQDAKQVVAALKSVKDLKLGDFATGTPPPHAATSLN